MRSIILTHRLGHLLRVDVSEFQPLPGDILAYNWTDSDGNPHALEMPHFCVKELGKTLVAIDQYISESRLSYLSCVEKSDDLTWMTLQLALRHASTKTVSTSVVVKESQPRYLA
jgi:hypothetical protein